MASSCRQIVGSNGRDLLNGTINGKPVFRQEQFHRRPDSLRPWAGNIVRQPDLPGGSPGGINWTRSWFWAFGLRRAAAEGHERSLNDLMDQESDLPFLDLSAPDFSTRSAQVHAARELGWCARTPYGLAVLRHREAGLLIRDRRLRQGSHSWPDVNRLSGSFAEFWKRSLIGMEGDRHRKVRRIAESALAPGHIEALRPTFTSIADDLIDGIGSDGRMEFVGEFALPYASQAVCALLGPGADWRQVGADAATLGLAMGIGCRDHQAEINSACDRLTELARGLALGARSDPGTDTYAGRLLLGFEGNDTLDEQDLLDLIVITVFGGVDTTRSQLGSAMALLAEHPEQWAGIRRDPHLVSGCVEESIRHRPATTWVTREALEDFEFGGRRIARGETLHLLVHSAAFDPAIRTGREFDASVRGKSHFGFGGGAHHCLGHLVARTDMECALAALNRRLESIAFSGTPQWLPDSGNTGPVRLPLICTISGA